MLKGTVGHQSWCQEQFLSQGRWDTKSFPQSLSCCTVGFASLLGPLKHLSPNQSSVCGGGQELTSSLQSRIGLGWNSWVTTGTPGETEQPVKHKRSNQQSPGGHQWVLHKLQLQTQTLPAFPIPHAPVLGQEQRPQSRIRSAAASANSSIQIPNGEHPGLQALPWAAPRGKSIAKPCAEPAPNLAGMVWEQPQPPHQRGPAGTQDSSWHRPGRLHTVCCLGNDTALEQCKPQPWRIRTGEQEVQVELWAQKVTWD